MQYEHFKKSNALDKQKEQHNTKKVCLLQLLALFL